MSPMNASWPLRPRDAFPWASDPQVLPGQRIALLRTKRGKQKKQGTVAEAP